MHDRHFCYQCDGRRPGARVVLIDEVVADSDGALRRHDFDWLCSVHAERLVDRERMLLAELMAPWWMRALTILRWKPTAIGVVFSRAARRP